MGFTPRIVWKDELREKMQSGDEILSINGRMTKDIPICDLIAKTSIFKISDSLLLTIKNTDGKVVEVATNRNVAN